MFTVKLFARINVGIVRLKLCFSHFNFQFYVVTTQCLVRLRKKNHLGLRKNMFCLKILSFVATNMAGKGLDSKSSYKYLRQEANRDLLIGSLHTSTIPSSSN